MNRVESWATTEVVTDSFNFIWNIKGFFNGFTEKIESPIFRGGQKSMHFWQLTLSRVKVDYMDLKVSVGLMLKNFGDEDNSPDRSLQGRFDVTLFFDDQSGFRLGSHSWIKNEFIEVKPHVEFEVITGIFASSRLLSRENSLQIKCNVCIEGGVEHKIGYGDIASSSIWNEMINKSKIIQDFQALYKSAEFADVAINTCTKTFMAHKAVLGARSKVFSAMFTTKMIESTMNSVLIVDFDDEVVEGMLEYMYTAQVKYLKEMPTEFLKIAEKYDLVELKEMCEYTIAESITIENVSDVLIHAHLYNAAILKERALQFINKNKQVVAKTKGFIDMAKGNDAIMIDLYLSN